MAELGASINQDIQDLAISHQHYVQRYTTHEVRKLEAILAKGEAEMRDRLLRSDLTEWTRTNYEKMAEALREIQRTYNQEYNQVLVSDLRQFGGVEAQAVKKQVNAAAGDLLSMGKLDFVAPTPAKLWAVAKSSPLMLEDGQSIMLEALLKGVGQRRLSLIEEGLRYSFTLGESAAKAARRLIGTPAAPGIVRKWSRRRAEVTTRTAFAHMWSTAHSLTYHENEDIARGYQWVSTLDAFTSDTCRYRDGRVWFFDERARASTSELLLEGEVYPPGHPSCRSTTAIVLKSYRELGLDREDIPDRTRMSATGQVPARTTYYDWLKRQPAEDQREVLGDTRYRMWQAGEITPDAFHAKDGRMLTLRELAARDYKIPERRSA